MRPLGGVRFEVPKDPGVNDWRIVSRNAKDGAPELELTFEPFGARRQNLDLRLVKSDFIQPYGVFRGQVLGSWTTAQPVEGRIVRGDLATGHAALVDVRKRRQRDVCRGRGGRRADRRGLRPLVAPHDR